MEIILIQDIQNLGKAGSVIEVKDGFARNFLFPQRLAMPATPSNLKRVEQEKLKIVKQKERHTMQALNLSNRLNGISVTIPVQTHDEDKLYGSVGIFDILNALKEEGFDIAKEAIVLEEPIKTLGVYDVKLKLHPEVEASIKVWVVKK